MLMIRANICQQNKNKIMTPYNEGLIAPMFSYLLGINHHLLRR